MFRPCARIVTPKLLFEARVLTNECVLLPKLLSYGLESLEISKEETGHVKVLTLTLKRVLT